MDIFANQSAAFLSPVQNMEGSSFQVHAEYTNSDTKKNQTQTASLKINVQTLKVSTGNNHAIDDTAMSGIDFPMSGIAKSLESHVKPKLHSSVNTGQVQQQADMARMLQPTIRALQSATDKAINRCAKGKGVPGAPTQPKALRNISHSQPGPLDDHTVTVPNTKSKKAKKKKNRSTNAQANNSSGGSVKKSKKKKPKNTEGQIANTLTRRQKSDALMASNAEKVAKEKADRFKQIHDKAPNPRDWQTLYEQEYQARTVMLRARQLRDEQALLSALDGLSLGGSKDTVDDCDLIL